MAKPIWINKGYNCHEISLGSLRGHVSWASDGSGFTAEFAGRKSKHHFQDLDEAKAAVIGIASGVSRELAYAIAELKEAGQCPKSLSD